MDLGTIADVVTAAAAVIALVFGIIQVLHLRADRRDRAAFETVHATQTAEYIRSIMVVFLLPDGSGAAEVEGKPEVRSSVEAVCITFEALGYAVFCRLVPLELVDDLVGGAVRVSWRKLAPYVERRRRESGSRKTWEWFQWLAERLEENLGPLNDLEGAQVRHRGWSP